MRELRDSSPEHGDAADVVNMLSSGLYRLRVLTVDQAAKMDASFIVELIPIEDSDKA